MEIQCSQTNLLCNIKLFIISTYFWCTPQAWNTTMKGVIGTRYRKARIPRTRKTRKSLLRSLWMIPTFSSRYSDCDFHHVQADPFPQPNVHSRLSHPQSSLTLLLHISRCKNLKFQMGLFYPNQPPSQTPSQIPASHSSRSKSPSETPNFKWGYFIPITRPES